MKLLIDQNLSPKLVNKLNGIFPDSKHLIDVGIDTAPDTTVWKFAKAHNFIILSKDTDFINLNVLYGFPPKIIWIQRGNCSTSQVLQIINDSFLKIKSFAGSPKNGILILR